MEPKLTKEQVEALAIEWHETFGDPLQIFMRICNLSEHDQKTFDKKLVRLGGGVWFSRKQPPRGAPGLAPRVASDNDELMSIECAKELHHPKRNLSDL